MSEDIARLIEAGNELQEAAVDIEFAAQQDLPKPSERFDAALEQWRKVVAEIEGKAGR